MAEIQSEECPVSCITAESRWLVEQEGRARQVKEASGASLFGPDSSRWPAAWFDAVGVIEQCRILEVNERIQTEIREMDR